jgi:hypothetical protein
MAGALFGIAAFCAGLVMVCLPKKKKSPTAR